MGAGEDLVGSPAVDGLAGRQASTAPLAPGACKTIRPPSLAAWATNGLWLVTMNCILGKIWRRRNTISLPERVEMGVDLVDQDHTFIRNSRRIVILLDKRLRVLIKVAPSVEDIQGERQEAPVSVTDGRAS